MSSATGSLLHTVEWAWVGAPEVGCEFVSVAAGEGGEVRGSAPKAGRPTGEVKALMEDCFLQIIQDSQHECPRILERPEGAARKHWQLLRIVDKVLLRGATGHLSQALAKLHLQTQGIKCMQDCQGIAHGWPFAR